MDTTAERLLEIHDRHGVDAIGIYMGNPAVHNYGMMTHQNNLFRFLHTRNRFSATSVDQLPHHLASLWLFGHKSLFPIPDVDRSDYFLMLGANPIASNGSLWTVPDVRKGIKKLTDFVTGLDEVAAAVSHFTPETAAPHTGIPAETIREIARSLAGAERGICYGRMGVSTQAYGALNQWLIQVINIATGNLDKEGGSLFTLPALDTISTGSPGGFRRHHSRVRGLPEFDRELPASTMAEEITTPGDGQIRALFTEGFRRHGVTAGALQRQPG